MRILGHVFHKTGHFSTPLRFVLIWGALTFITLTLSSIIVIVPVCKSSLYNALSERYTLMAQYFADTLSQGLNLGIHIQDVYAPPQLLQTLKNQDSAIESIIIFSNASQNPLSQRSASIIFATDSDLKNTSLPIHWLPHIVQDTPSYVKNSDTSSVCINIFTPHAEPAGGVILTWKHDAFLPTLYTYYSVLCICVVVFTIFACFMGYMICAFLWKPVEQSLHSMHETYDTALRTQYFAPFIPQNTLEHLFHTMYRRTKSLFDVLAMVQSNIDPSASSNTVIIPLKPKNSMDSDHEKYRIAS